MQSTLEMQHNDQPFVASLADIKAQAQTSGWAFWRGVVVGFLASFPLAYAAVEGSLPLVG